MQYSSLVRLALAMTMIGSAIASPLVARQDCQCAVCDVGPGDCAGDDLKDYNACVAYVLGTCGRDCGDLEPGTGAQDGCYAAEIGRSKPCENKCVQQRLGGTGDFKF